MRNSLALVFLLGTILAAWAGSPPPTVQSVGEKVMCTCGCVAILNQCPHQGCSTHDEVQAAIQKLIAEGKDEPAILQALTARYGAKILAAPPTRGFSLAAWILPSVGLVFGLVAVLVIVRRWRRPAVAPIASGPASVDPKLLAAMEEEMKASGLQTRE